MAKSPDRKSGLVLLVLILFPLFFRLATLMMMNTGLDEGDHLIFAKALVRGLPYSELSPRTMRFAAILPFAFAQLIPRNAPSICYVLPLINSAAATAIAFLIGLRLRGTLTGFLAGLVPAILVHPPAPSAQYRKEINETMEKDLPIVSAKRLRGGSAISICEASFIGSRWYERGRPPAHAARMIGDREYLVLGGEGREPNAALAAVRSPFRVTRIGLGSLGGLNAESFAGMRGRRRILMTNKSGISGTARG